MKIGIITNLYPPYARGGAENVIVRTVGQLIAMGHDVFVITGQPRTAGVTLTLDRSSTERTYRFFPTNLYFTLDDYKHSWPVRLLWHIVDAFSPMPGKVVGRILDEEKPDVVFTHNLKGLGLGIPQAIQTRTIPHIHVLHDLQLIIPSGLLIAGKEYILTYAKPFYAVYRAICRWRMGRPGMAVSPSQFIVDQYTRYGFFKGLPFVMQPNPTPNFRTVQRKERIGGPLKLLFVGQLGAHKGVAFLLDAFARLAIDAQLLIVGEGPLSDLVKKRAATDHRIVPLGYMVPDELMKCYGVADALVVPSLCYENSPTVIYEALNAGVPVLASRIGGVGELVREGETGYLFAPGVTEDFLRVVHELDARKDEFAKSRERITSSVAPFSLDKYADRLIALAKHVIGETK
ncbi:glycosyltransferase [Candidatus Uhrbacteria bacterium]|nr:glycosyltransferase [Candidatus Uhrbacteria bacterium]